MSRNSKILALILLVCANIALLTYMGLRRSTASGTTSAPRRDVDALPISELLDDGGRRVRLNELTGRALLVQFVNPAVSAQIDAVSKAVSAFGASQVSFLLITKDSQELHARLPDLPENVLVVQRGYAELKELFNVPECCERRFIFNREGSVQYKDYYYEADLRPRLHSLLDTTTQDFPSALAGALESVREGRFASLKEQTRHGKHGKAVVLLFDSVCTSCDSGEAVKSAERFAVAHKDVPLIVMLPNDYTTGDLENLKANFRADFSVERADPALTEKWSALSGVYGPSVMNGAVVLVEGGKLSVLTDMAEAEQALSRR